MRAGINNYQIPGDFLTYTYRIDFEFINQAFFTYVHLIQKFMVLGIFHVCVCVLNSLFRS